MKESDAELKICLEAQQFPFASKMNTHLSFALELLVPSNLAVPGKVMDFMVALIKIYLLQLVKRLLLLLFLQRLLYKEDALHHTMLALQVLN